MINVTINGVTKQFKSGTVIKDIIEAFGDDASQFVCAANIGGKMFDLDHKVAEDCEIMPLTFRDIKEQRELVGEQDVAADDVDGQAEFDNDYEESEFDVLDELSIGNVFSQNAIDAIENEIKNMVSGGLDEGSMSFEPQRALELLASVADEMFADSDDEAVYEAVSEAVYGENIEPPALVETADDDFEEAAEDTDVFDEEAIEEPESSDDELTEEIEETAEKLGESEGTDEVLEISNEQIDAIVERSAVEAELNSENIEDLCDEVISEIDKPEETLEQNEFDAETILSGLSTDSDESEQDDKAAHTEASMNIRKMPKASKKKRSKAASNTVKAAAIIIAVAALGWFAGKTAIQAIGSQDGNVALISRSDIVSQADVVSKSDVSGSDVLSNYDAALLTFGSANELVESVQVRLSELGYFERSNINGTYDQNTVNAVAEFRLDNNIDRTGYIDSDTFELLFSGKNVTKASQTANQSENAAEAAATTMSTTGTTSTTSTATSRLTTTTTKKTTTTTQKTTTTTKKTTATTQKTTTTTKKTTTTTRRTTTTTRRRTTTTTTQSTTASTTEPITEPTSVTPSTEAPSTATPTSAPTAAPEAPQPPATGGDSGEDTSSQE